MLITPSAKSSTEAPDAPIRNRLERSGTKVTPMSELPDKVDTNLKLMFHPQLLYLQQQWTVFVHDEAAVDSEPRGWRQCKATKVQFYFDTFRTTNAINSAWTLRKWKTPDTTLATEKYLQPKPKPFKPLLIPKDQQIPNARYVFITGVEYYLDDKKDVKYTMGFNADGSFQFVYANKKIVFGHLYPHVMFVSRDLELNFEIARIKDQFEPEYVRAVANNTPDKAPKGDQSSVRTSQRSWSFRT